MQKVFKNNVLDVKKISINIFFYSDGCRASSTGWSDVAKAPPLRHICLTAPAFFRPPDVPCRTTSL